MDKILLYSLMLINGLVLACNLDDDCQINEFCELQACTKCINCSNLNRNVLPSIICSKNALTDCGTCLKDYEDVTFNYTESLLSGECFPKFQSNDSLIKDENEEPYHVSGWTVFGFAILGAFVGFIFAGIAIVGMSIYKRKKERTSLTQKSNEKRFNDDDQLISNVKSVEGKKGKSRPTIAGFHKFRPLKNQR